MSDGPVKSGMQGLRRAAWTIVGVAVAARLAWELLSPLVPVLISLIVLLGVLGVAVFGRRK